MPQLTDKNLCFIQEYLIDLNATQAAIRAGYSAKSASAQGYRLLNRPDVRAEIDKAQAARAERTQITADKVLEELGKIGFANMNDYLRPSGDGDVYVHLTDLTRDQAAAISEVIVEDFKDGRGVAARDVRRVRFRLLDKRAALLDIGKHLGMFVDRKELTGKNGGPIEVSETPPSERLKALLARIAGDGEGGDGETGPD